MLLRIGASKKSAAARDLAPLTLGSREVGNRINHLLAISAATQASLHPTGEQAARLFDDIMGWRPPDYSSTDTMAVGLLRPLFDNVPSLLGDSLRNVVVPSLDSTARRPERLRKLIQFIREVPRSTAAGALPYFADGSNGTQLEITGAIQQAIGGRTEEEVAGGVAAVETWVLKHPGKQSVPLPSQLAGRVISAIESGREIGMVTVLHCARKLVETGALSEKESLRVASALGNLLIEQEYERIDPDTHHSVTVSLIRAECVRLARALENSGISTKSTTAWLNVANADPLPEVRFALAMGD